MENLTIPQWMLVMTSILRTNDTTISKISKELDITYSHAHKIVMLLEKAGYLLLEKIGRKRFVYLTRPGLELQDMCKKIMLSGNFKRVR